MQMNSAEICSLLKEKIENFSGDSTASNQGKVLTAGDGVVRISGLEMAQQGEIVNIEQVARALVMNLEQDWIGAVILGDASEVAEGMRVESTSKVLDVPVGPELLGRVVNALGEPLDNLGPINSKKRAPIERLAPGVLSRKAVRCPLQTGYKAVDAMVPIGKGQRELIIGDRQTGKTSLALDTILNQKHSGVKCIYVAIGQKASTVAELVGHLQKNDAMKYTTVMVASAADCAAMQYIAPYAACSIGEYFRDRGEHALIVYDDLSKHAVAYRQLSLLLRRPPGREAFPGDVFYLHARLLERAASVNRAFIQSQNPAVELDPAIEFGSLTALPIIETQAGDISAFVPTNVISITDGQLFLDTDLFNSGVRPAINPGISVSRIGGAAQHPFIQKLSGKLRTALAQYRELQSFSQFASDLDASTKTQLKEGEIITLLLKQGQYAPLRASEQVMILAAINNGLAFELEKENVAEFENALLEYVRHYYASFLDELDGAESADPLTFSKIMDILSSFHKTEVF